MIQTATRTSASNTGDRPQHGREGVVVGSRGKRVAKFDASARAMASVILMGVYLADHARPPPRYSLALIRHAWLLVILFDYQK